MSTLLVNTTGGSKFAESTQLFEGANKLTSSIFQKFGLSLNLNLDDDDKKPELKPSAGAIDVVHDFSWYSGPKATPQALSKIPTVFLTEREQLLSSLVSGAMMYITAGQNTLGAIKGGSNLGSGGSGDISSALGKVNELVDSGLNFDFSSSEDQAILKQNNLNSLEGIYFTRETGFKYRFPIYGSPSSVSNDWDEGSPNGSSIITKIAGAASIVTRNIAEIVNLAQPGVYIEKPQYFQGAQQGKTESITFPLVNTVRRGSKSPLQQNYELLWLLAFQNKPYKTSFSRTPPPKIYTVQSPGRFSMPYAYISGMDVSFLGTTRNAKVFVPSGNGEGSISSKQISTPVPEAYQVTLNFTSLIGDYGNTMLSDAFSTSIIGDKVKIGNN